MASSYMQKQSQNYKQKSSLVQSMENTIALSNQSCIMTDAKLGCNQPDKCSTECMRTYFSTSQSENGGGYLSAQN